MLNTLEAIPLPRDGGSQQATLTARVDPILTAKRGGEPIFSSMERGGDGGHGQEVFALRTRLVRFIRWDRR